MWMLSCPSLSAACRNRHRLAKPWHRTRPSHPWIDVSQVIQALNSVAPYVVDRTCHWFPRVQHISDVVEQVFPFFQEPVNISPRSPSPLPSPRYCCVSWARLLSISSLLLSHAPESAGISWVLVWNAHRAAGSFSLRPSNQESDQLSADGGP